MRIDAMRLIIKQLPDIMVRLNLPKEFRSKHRQFNGKAHESSNNIATSDIEVEIGSLSKDCQYCLTFDYLGKLKAIYRIQNHSVNNKDVLSKVEIPMPPQQRKFNFFAKLFGLE